MTQDTQRESMSKLRVLYQLPGMETALVRSDIPYRDDEAGALTMDVYYPHDSTPSVISGRAPAVIFVTGFPDAGARMMFGSRFKEMGSFVSWARLVSASGLVGITYANSEPADVRAVMAYVRQNAVALGIDETRIGIWACSGHGPMALTLLMESERLSCAVLAYPYTLDLDGATVVADAARQFRFATVADRTIGNLSQYVPVFIARAGADAMPGLNASLDRFVAAALAANLPLTVTNVPAGSHAFDLVEATPATRIAVQQMLAFLKLHLTA